VVGWEILWCGAEGGRDLEPVRVQSVNACPPNLLTRQYKNQPEREFLANGENPKIRKIRNNAQN